MRALCRTRNRKETVANSVYASTGTPRSWKVANRLHGRRYDSKKKNGRDDRIRTCDILLPKQARYQAAPHPDVRLDESLYMINEPHDNGKRKDGKRRRAARTARTTYSASARGC